MFKITETRKAYEKMLDELRIVMDESKVDEATRDRLILVVKRRSKKLIEATLADSAINSLDNTKVDLGFHGIG